MPFSPFLRNQRGVALLYLIIFFTLIGVLMSFGAKKLGTIVTQGKINETRVGLEHDVRMIVAWSVKNGRLPLSSEYPGIFGTAPLDAWGKPVVFGYYSSMSNTSTGGLCGRTGSSITHNGKDVAFVLLSGGDDMNISSTPDSSGFFNGPLSGLRPEDLYRVVSLNELQSQAGCPGTTPGALRIVNNELPGACKRSNYSATIVGDGGVPPYITYAVSGLPAGLSASSATILGNSTTARGPYNVSVTMTDSAANVVKRSYVLNLMSSCSY